VKDIHPVVSLFKINLSDKLSQDPLDRFSPYFHHMVVYDLTHTRLMLAETLTHPIF